jgi:hypothetical protein
MGYVLQWFKNKSALVFNWCSCLVKTILHRGQGFDANSTNITVEFFSPPVMHTETRAGTLVRYIGLASPNFPKADHHSVHEDLALRSVCVYWGLASKVLTNGLQGVGLMIHFPFLFLIQQISWARRV